MFEYEIDTRRELALLKYTGDVDDEELMRSFNCLIEAEGFQLSFDVVTDCRASHDFLTVNVTRSLATLLREREGVDGKWASITSSTRGTALAMLFSQQVQGVIEHRVFSSIEGASGWLHKDLRQCGIYVRERSGEESGEG
jgi:hypothetical protein